MVRLGSGASLVSSLNQQAKRASVIDSIWNQYPCFTELEVRSHLARFGYRGEEVFKLRRPLRRRAGHLRFAELALRRLT